MTQNKIRVAVGGQGRSGYGIHGKYFRQDTGRFDVVAAADQLPERRAEAMADFDAHVYEDWRPMLEEGGFDLFVNALPSPLHVDASIEALNRGYHVISEKPMARTVADFDRIVAAAEKNNRLLFPFQNRRLEPYFVQNPGGRRVGRARQDRPRPLQLERVRPALGLADAPGPFGREPAEHGAPPGRSGPLPLWLGPHAGGLLPDGLREPV